MQDILPRIERAEIYEGSGDLYEGSGQDITLNFSKPKTESIIVHRSIMVPRSIMVHRSMMLHRSIMVHRSINVFLEVRIVFNFFSNQLSPITYRSRFYLIPIFSGSQGSAK